MAKKNAVAQEEQKFITSAELDEKFDKFGDKVLALFEGIEKKIEAKPVDAPQVAAVTEAIKKAAPDDFSVNDKWDAIAKDIIGEAVDHTEVVHEDSGGIKFTVVIKKSFSNAGQMYWDLVKTDRRTMAVNNTGIEGVKNWCNLIKQNLARPSAANQRNN